MSPTTPGPNDILWDDNYFFWEWDSRMELARKGLVSHVELNEDDTTVDRSASAWKAEDMKAFAIVSRRLSPHYQTMIREARSARHAWEILEAFFVRRNLHNRIQLRHQLHEFKMTKDDNLLDHMMKFDNLCMNMAAVGDGLEDDEKTVIFLGSLSTEYDAMFKIIKNNKEVMLAEAKEMLRREYDANQKREVLEVALNVDQNRNGNGAHRGRQQEGQRKHQYRNKKNGFTGKCYKCQKRGHKQAECPNARSGVFGGRPGSEFVFVVSDNVSSWVLDSGASSHMTFDNDEFTEYRPTRQSIGVSVADGARLEVEGVGTVEIQLSTGCKVAVTNVLHVPGLDRRLLSIPELASKGFAVTFDSNECIINRDDEIVARAPKRGKLYDLADVLIPQHEAHHAQVSEEYGAENHDRVVRQLEIRGTAYIARLQMP